MVEQVRVSPEEVRGYGNICEGHTLEDFIVSDSGLAKEKENVHGALTDVYRLVYSLYGLIFSFDKGNKQLYLQMGVADTLSFGFDTANKQLYLVDENDTGFNLGFDEDTNELYITDDAPPIVHNYTLALDSESYTTSGSLSVSATLLDDGVAVEGATVSFTGGVSTVTATTNSSGVATATVNFTSSGTLTASYSNVSDTATVTVTVGPSYIINDDATTDNRLTLFGSSISLRNSGTVSVDYDSSTPCYVIKNTTANAEAFLPYPALEGITSSFKMTTESQSSGTNVCGIALYYYIDSNNWGGVKEEGQGMWFSTKTNGTFTETNKYQNTAYKNLNIKNEFIYDANAGTLTINRYDKDDPSTIFKTFTMNIPVTITSSVKWGTSTTWSTTQRNLYEIKAEYI